MRRFDYWICAAFAAILVGCTPSTTVAPGSSLAHWAAFRAAAAAGVSSDSLMVLHTQCASERTQNAGIVQQHANKLCEGTTPTRRPLGCNYGSGVCIMEYTNMCGEVYYVVTADTPVGPAQYCYGPQNDPYGCPVTW